MGDWILLTVVVDRDRYNFIVREDRRDWLANKVGEFAFNPQLNFTEEDAANVLKKFDEHTQNLACHG